jgi:hypothetical protein
MADLTSNQVCNICCVHYNAGIRCCALGSAVEGGRLYAKHGSVGWIVANAAQQVSRTWANRGDAVTVAQAANACGDWFVPSRTDLQYAHDCKSFWDSFSSTRYWSSTESSATTAWQVRFDAGAGGSVYPIAKTTAYCVRAFRRVFY